MFLHTLFKKIFPFFLIFILLITGGIYFGEYELEKANKHYMMIEALLVFSDIKQLAISHYVENHTWQEATKLLEQACINPSVFEGLKRACVNNPRYISAIETLPLQYIFSFKEHTHLKLKIHFIYSPVKEKWQCHGEGEDSTLLHHLCEGFVAKQK
ncbi:MAG: hypothetical protein PHP00_14890 [Thiotrichaceae bacterium]|nr:hypothetical protein [Thiotrichaceae bacterium]